MLKHYTLNTGHTRASPRAEVADNVLPVVAPLLLPGTHRVPGVRGGYELVVPASPAGWLGTVFQAKAPIATIGIAATEEDAAVIWPAMLANYKPDSPWYMQPAKQPALPWCSALLFLNAPAHEWLGDFERCLAWAWIEQHAKRRPG